MTIIFNDTEIPVDDSIREKTAAEIGDDARNAYRRQCRDEGIDYDPELADEAYWRARRAAEATARKESA